ncbi:MAG: hydroxylamine reductase [Lentisphaeria bacterium]|nr:hydroxylamine reductase [Lentisphaeria bacterium]
MFCFQCQETCGNQGCTMRGICGKTAETSNLMDALIQQLKIIAKTCEPNRENGLFVVQSLFMTITNTNFDKTRLALQLKKAQKIAENQNISAPLGVLDAENEDIRSLRELLTYGLKGIAAYADHAAMLGFEDKEIYQFLFKALAATAEDHSAEELTVLVMECGATAVKTMALLDQANTAAYGNPEISTVRTNVGTRPGILVSGHDLKDMKELLEQSKDAGIDIYTHSEMLPAHYYPELKKYPHLYGNYGNAWHLQNKEFASFNGPILMTTNCITPVQESYRERIFTTGMAGYPGIPHIADREKGKEKDFSIIIELAKKCPPPSPLENGTITGGFAHQQVLNLADKIIEAVKSGAVKRFIVMAGCDGRQSARKYFTETAQLLPADTLILTAGCAKYRYNKLSTGDIGGIPRVLDAGQCNDCYSLARIALKLKEAFGLQDVNDLPLSFDIAWYEQKAVAVLLAVLSLGFKNIRLGPTLPAFLSPNTAEILVRNFGIKGISTPENDVNAMLKGE